MQILDYTKLIWAYSSSSSGGQYLKSECIIRGKKYYLKLSDYFYGTFRSHEAILEVIVSRLGIYLGFPVLKYTGSLARIMLDGTQYCTYVSKSLNYCGAGQTAMPLYTYYKLHCLNNESPLNFCQRIGMSEYLNYIFIFDYLIMNIDRHGRNIEILTGDKGISQSPIFDNGRCLTFARGNDIDNICNYNYQVPIQGNNFVGGLNLEGNLRYVTHAYQLPRLTNECKKQLFYGLNSILHPKHIEVIWEILQYRYQVLQRKGIIL